MRLLFRRSYHVAHVVLPSTNNLPPTVEEEHQIDRQDEDREVAQKMREEAGEETSKCREHGHSNRTRDDETRNGPPWVDSLDTAEDRPHLEGSAAQWLGPECSGAVSGQLLACLGDRVTAGQGKMVKQDGRRPRLFEGKEEEQRSAKR